MTEEEEAEEIILRLTFPEAFSESEKIKARHGLDMEEELRTILRAELDARRSTGN